MRPQRYYFFLTYANLFAFSLAYIEKKAVPLPRQFIQLTVMHMKTKISTLLFALVASAGMLFADIIDHVQIGELYYNLNTADQTAEVTNHINYGNFQNYPAEMTYRCEKHMSEDIESISASSSDNMTKVLRNGQILIIKNDKTYTLTGQEVE